MWAELFSVFYQFADVFAALANDDFRTADAELANSLTLAPVERAAAVNDFVTIDLSAALAKKLGPN